jgi:hypothetical protein
LKLTNEQEQKMISAVLEALEKSWPKSWLDGLTAETYAEAVGAIDTVLDSAKSVARGTLALMAGHDALIFDSGRITPVRDLRDLPMPDPPEKESK